MYRFVVGGEWYESASTPNPPASHASHASRASHASQASHASRAFCDSNAFHGSHRWIVFVSYHSKPRVDGTHGCADGWISYLGPSVARP